MIYTRNATCAPIRAEEGITGILTPPSSSTSFRDLPDDERIGGYPNAEQLSRSEIDPATLDAEGRCVILEFRAFVLIGTYCPAERDETRTDFRRGFLEVLDARIRNLVAMGKSVFWTGDLNISREEIDTAMAEEMMRKNNVDNSEWISSPARRLLNQLLVGGKVYGERDEGRENSILWDICRAFHTGRKGMYTCWETKVNARPGNYGARIDYALCSADMKDWWSDSNIQEGLMGSDHCPVYAVMKDKVMVDGAEVYAMDLMNPPGTFVNGERKQEWSTKNLLPTSGKLIAEFDRRRNIRDMFSRTPSTAMTRSISDLSEINGVQEKASATAKEMLPAMPQESPIRTSRPESSPAKAVSAKRSQNAEGPPPKRSKSGSQPNTSTGAGKGQQSLKGFFKAKTIPEGGVFETVTTSSTSTVASSNVSPQKIVYTTDAKSNEQSANEAASILEQESASFASRKTWGKLFSKPIAPKCEHDEPCKTMLTKKPGINCGRSFWMCNRPLGPSGKQERDSQWRCGTFVWASDWDGHAGEPG